MTRKEAVAELRRRFNDFIRGLPDCGYLRVMSSQDGFDEKESGSGYIRTAEFGVEEEREGGAE